MLERLSQTIGLAAAIYVACTRTAPRPVALGQINQILKEVWNAQKLENELLGDRLAFEWDDPGAHAAAHLALTTRAPVKGPWVRAHLRRKRQRQERRRRLRRSALRSITLAPPRG